MKKLMNLIGLEYERWTVIKSTGRNKHGQFMWLCRCCCGNEKIVLGNSLRNGDSRSCGCLAKEMLIKRSVTHGFTRNGKTSKTYRAWTNITKRCNDKNNPDYKDYRGRDINVCHRWSSKNQRGFQNFLKDMGECPPGKSIDRINNNKGYYKRNCKWSTDKEQARNRRNNHVLTMDGTSACYAEWEEITGIKQSVISRRIKRRWSARRALTTPMKNRTK